MLLDFFAAIGFVMLVVAAISIVVIIYGAICTCVWSLKRKKEQGK